MTSFRWGMANRAESGTFLEGETRRFTSRKALSGNAFRKTRAAILCGCCIVGAFSAAIPKGLALPTKFQDLTPNPTPNPVEVPPQDVNLSTPPSLLEAADCQIAGSTNESQILNQPSLVSINRQVFDRQFALGTYDNANFVTLSCRADANRFSSVDLQMGVDDNAVRDNVNLTVDVYQGGNLRQTYRNMRAGSIANVVLDLADPEVPTNSNNFAIEVTCHTQRANCNLQFLEARLYPIDSALSLPQVITPSPSPSPESDPVELPPQENSTIPAPEPEDEDEDERPSRDNINPIEILRDANEARELICGIFGC